MDIRERVAGAVTAVAVAGLVFTWAATATAQDSPAPQVARKVLVESERPPAPDGDAIGATSATEVAPVVAIPAPEAVVPQETRAVPDVPAAPQVAPVAQPETPRPVGDCSIVQCVDGIPVPTDGSTVRDTASGYSDEDGWHDGTWDLDGTWHPAGD
jgi:hypothetical protein